MRLPRNILIILFGTGALDLLFRSFLKEVAFALSFNWIFKSTANAISARFGWSEATVIGGLAIAGSGGDAGAFGPGGHARATDHGYIGIEGLRGAGDIGAGGPDMNVESRDGQSGIGGEANQRDGSGGRGDRSDCEVLYPPGGPHGGMLADCGPRGGGQNTPDYDRKLSVVVQLRKVYAITHVGSPSTVLDDKNSVPLAWINQQLAALGAQWRVRIVRGEYEFFPLPAFWPRELINDRNLLAGAQPHFGVQ